MNEYISNEIAKNIKGMSETIGKDESKYWYFAGKVEALSLLMKEMKSRSIIVSFKELEIDEYNCIDTSKCDILIGDRFETIDKSVWETEHMKDFVEAKGESVKLDIQNSIKDNRPIVERFKEMFGLRG